MRLPFSVFTQARDKVLGDVRTDVDLATRDHGDRPHQLRSRAILGKVSRRARLQRPPGKQFFRVHAQVQHW